MMNRFEVLRSSTKILKPYFLEASAGTGKTFAIEHIVVRALLESEEALSIDQILVVTFTRAATRELKMRIRSNLQKTALALQQGMEGPDYLEQIRKEGAAKVFSSLRKIEEALSLFDQSQIFTLHGFCHKMLSEYAFEAGLPFRLQNPDEKGSDKKELKELIYDFLRVGLAPSSYSLSQLDAVLRKYKRSVERLVISLTHYVERKIDAQAVPTFDESYREFIQELSDLWKHQGFDASLVKEDFIQIVSSYNKLSGQDRYEEVEQLAYFLQNKEITKDQFDKILGSDRYFLQYLHPKYKKARVKKHEDKPYHYPSLFEILYGKLWKIIETASSGQKTFLRMVKDCRELWHKIGAEDNVSPDDILAMMRKALQNEGFYERVSTRYRIAVIDEFQDTDPIQWEIFEKLFLQNCSRMLGLYLVGDPKQSIYAFRNADVYTYLAALKAIGEENRVYLDTNYRSTGPLVHALNILFTQNIAQDWMQLPMQKRALIVPPVRSKESMEHAEGRSEEASVHFFISKASSGREKKWPTEEIEYNQQFPFIEEQLKKIHKEKKIRFGQFAILVKDRYQARRVQDYLKQKNVPCSYKRSVEVKSSLCYLALYDLILALAHPDSLGALKKVMLGPFIGYSAHDVVGGMELELLQKAKFFFSQASLIAQQNGWGAFFQHFFESRWKSQDKTLLDHMLELKDASFYFECRQFLQIILHYTAKNSLTPLELVEFMASLAKLDAEDPILSVPSEEEEDQVIIMTIHASKGLEFDVVFALGLCARHSAKEEYIKTQARGKEEIAVKDLSSSVCLDAIFELDAEKLRHLYVALTRAKSQVFIPIALDFDAKELEYGQAAPIELLCAGFNEERYSIEKAYAKIPLITEESLSSHFDLLKKSCSLEYSLLKNKQENTSSSYEEEKIALCFNDPLKFSFEMKSLLSFSSLAIKEESSLGPIGVIKEENEEIKSLRTLPLGAATGTVLHRIFENMIRDGLHAPFDKERMLAMILDEIKGTFLDGWHDVLLEMSRATMEKPIVLGNETFCLSDVPSSDFFLEMEFVFSNGPHLIKGFIDGVFKRGSTYYILDWKSNFLGDTCEDYSNENMKKAMQSHQYFLQAAIYTEALKRYLKLFTKEKFDRLYGGALYFFVRGDGCYHFIPDASLLQQYHPQMENLWQEMT